MACKLACKENKEKTCLSYPRCEGCNLFTLKVTDELVKKEEEFNQRMREESNNSRDDLSVNELNYVLDDIIETASIKDNVNHPSHYNNGKYECIEVMVDTFGVEFVKTFCVGNAFKYLYRYKHKNGVEDIKKAHWYLNKFMTLLEYDEK